MLTSQERFLLIIYCVCINGNYSLQDLELVFQKLKGVVDKCVDIEDFKKQFTALVESLYNEANP